MFMPQQLVGNAMLALVHASVLLQALFLLLESLASPAKHAWTSLGLLGVVVAEILVVSSSCYLTVSMVRPMRMSQPQLHDLALLRFCAMAAFNVLGGLCMPGFWSSRKNAVVSSGFVMMLAGDLLPAAHLLATLPIVAFTCA